MWHLIRWAWRTGVVTAPPPALAGPAPAGTKGRPALEVERCVGDAACARACPTDAISLGPVTPAEAPASTARRAFRLDYGACVFCGLCAEACAPGALRMTADDALSTLRREDLVLNVLVPAVVQSEEVAR
jgi:hydrogenase-4 component H